MTESTTDIDTKKILAKISEDIHISLGNIEKTIQLLKEGNTVPFIARYRKELTGGIDETKIREIQQQFEVRVTIEERRNTVLRLIKEQGKLSEELQASILNASNLQDLEDLYLPFKPKFKTLGTKAKERGLEPLANIIRQGVFSGDPLDFAKRFINAEKEVPDESAALEGAVDIIAEDVGSEPEMRKYTREIVSKRGIIKTKINETKVKNEGTEKSENPKENTDLENLGKKRLDPQTFQDYFDFKIDITTIKPHQLLAIDRAEEAEIITIDIDTPEDDMIQEIKKKILGKNPKMENIFLPYYEKAIEAGFKRYIIRSIKREVWKILREEAEIHAIKLFATNLKNLLMSAPLKHQAVVGIDPGYRTGCKIAVIDPYGKYLENAVIYPHPPKNLKDAAKNILFNLAKKHNAYTFAIGNGTASRETETLVADLIKEQNKTKLPFAYSIVSEAGASVYSASELAKEEFPDLDATVRGAISIARRLQDPLSELIKIDPKSIGVGLYQHDVNQTLLKQELDAVIEDCVNSVGVDLNTASSRLLEYISGLNKRLAKEIVAFREKNGPFKSRDQLHEVKGMGPKSFEQSAGFLKIRNAINPLDRTFVHPESYHLAMDLLKEATVDPLDIIDSSKREMVKKKLFELKPNLLSRKYECDADKIRYLIEQLIKPDLDPRENSAPILRTDVLSIDDLKVGMVLKGTVRNVVDFGAFVDIGVKINGLVHKSEIANTFVTDITTYLAVGDIKDFMIISIDKSRNRIQLSLKRVPKSN